MLKAKDILEMIEDLGVDKAVDQVSKLQKFDFDFIQGRKEYQDYEDEDEDEDDEEEVD